MKRYKILAIILSAIVVLGISCANESPASGGIGISIKEYNVDYTAQTISVEVLSNLDVTLEIPANAIWINQSRIGKKSSPNSTTFVLNIVENNSPRRNSTIKFVAIEADIFNTITITQAEPPITLSQSGTLDDEVKRLYPGEGQIAAITKLTVKGAAMNGVDFSYLGRFLTNLTTLDISGTATTAIRSNEFDGKAKFISISLPNTLTTIGSSAFKSTGLTSITIPASVTTIGARAFQDCANLTNIVLAEGLVTIVQSAFQNTGVRSVTIPASVTIIGQSAFQNSSDLTNLVLQEGLLTIEGWAFRGTGLTSGTVTIPSTVTSIGTEAFPFAVPRP